MDKLDKKIAIIGMGHMGKSLLKGLLRGGFSKQNILLSGRKEDSKKVTQGADWIILAVKPFQIKEVAKQIRDGIQDKLLISVAAAVSIATIEKFTENKKIVRIMPNLPVAYGQGIIGLFANEAVSHREENEVKNLFSLLGTVLELKSEKELDNVTLISACGPGLVSYFITMFSKTAISLGLSENDSELLAVKTFMGTLHYLKKTGLSSQELQHAVATKGGVTEEIINSMEVNKIASYFDDSMRKGQVKIDTLRREVNFNSND